MSEPLEQIQKLIDHAKAIARYLGAEPLNEESCHERSYQDEFLCIEANVETQSIAVSVKVSPTLVARELSEHQWISVLCFSEEHGLEVFRPWVTLHPATESWSDRLQVLAELAQPEPQLQLTDFLQAIADTPDVDVERVILDIGDLEKLGFRSATWLIKLLQRLVSIPPENRQLLLALLSASPQPVEPTP